MQITIATPLLLLLAGCLVAPATDTNADDPVTDTGAELTSAPATDGASEAGASALADLPRWHCYQRGKDASAYPTGDFTPVLAMQLGDVVAIREGDEQNPERWVSLDLTLHWKMGDRYFDELIRLGRVTAIDLLVINSALLQRGAHLPRMPPKGRGREETGAGTGDWKPFPHPGDDHTGPSGQPGGKPHGGGPPPNATGGKYGGKYGDPHGGHGSSGGHPPTPEEQAADQARRNGVNFGDPAPKPSPFDGYQPKPGEERETFKCEGEVLFGYRHACPDFDAVPDGLKWGAKLSGWETRTFSAAGIAKLSHADMVVLCQASLAASSIIACVAASGACAVGTVVTVGGVSMPCTLGIALVCSTSGAAGILWTSRCDAVMGGGK